MMRIGLRWIVIIVLLVIVAIPSAFLIQWWRTPNREPIRTVIGRARLALFYRFTNHNDGRMQDIVRGESAQDDWTTFGHDDLRSGFEKRPTGITRATAGSLVRRWVRSLRQPGRPSPIVANGFVYVATDAGTVFALDVVTGEIRWQRTIGNSVRMTPALIGDDLLVGVYGQFRPVGQKPFGASFWSLDSKTGAVRWHTPLPGLVRSEPVVLNGIIYEGLAGGDSFSGCFDGRVVALDQRTGKVLPRVYHTTNKPNNGDGVWAPFSTDGKTIYVGTGNACDESKSGLGDTVVALTPDLRRVWETSLRFPGIEDSDVGGGVDLVGARAYVVGKSGFLYTLDRKTGKVLAREDLEPFARNGGSIGTPTGDGTMIMTNSGPKKDPDTAGTATGSDMMAFDWNGRLLYRIPSLNPIAGYAAFVPGVGFMTQDRKLIAFDSSNGTILWSSDLGDLSYASPTVVPSGVYQVTNAGDVFAFAPNQRSP